jgi:hypothetical protein
MKTLILVLSMFAAGVAQAHESLVPHIHPHGISMLPGLDTIAVAVIALTAAAIAYLKFGRAP